MMKRAENINTWKMHSTDINVVLVFTYLALLYTNFPHIHIQEISTFFSVLYKFPINKRKYSLSQKVYSYWISGFVNLLFLNLKCLLQLALLSTSKVHKSH